MWVYEKKLQFPVNIKNPDPKLAKVIISQLGGPDEELHFKYVLIHKDFGNCNKQKFPCPR